MFSPVELWIFFRKSCVIDAHGWSAVVSDVLRRGTGSSRFEWVPSTSDSAPPGLKVRPVDLTVPNHTYRSRRAPAKLQPPAAYRNPPKVPIPAFLQA